MTNYLAVTINGKNRSCQEQRARVSSGNRLRDNGARHVGKQNASVKVGCSNNRLIRSISLIYSRYLLCLALSQFATRTFLIQRSPLFSAHFFSSFLNAQRAFIRVSLVRHASPRSVLFIILANMSPSTANRRFISSLKSLYEHTPRESLLNECYGIGNFATVLIIFKNPPKLVHASRLSKTLLAHRKTCTYTP